MYKSNTLFFFFLSYNFIMMYIKQIKVKLDMICSEKILNSVAYQQ
jgi:hypothetical protein